MYKSISSIFLGSIFLFGCKTSEKEKTPITDPTKKEQKTLTVDGIIAKESILSDAIQVTGSVLANEEVELRSEISGRVTGIYFSEGSFVKKGQLLVQVNDDELKAQAKKIEVEMELQREREDRQKQLLTAKAISQDEFDITSTNVKLLQANLDILQSQIKKTQILAPFSGKIGLKHISIGSIITTSTTIASLQETNPIKLDFNIPEKYNHLVKTGSQVTFTLANSTKNYTATVHAKEPKIDPQTRTVSIRAKASNPNQELVPGAFAEIKMKISQQYKAIKIPTVAYIPDINGAKVLSVKDGKVKPIPVKAGTRTENDIEVTGISVGDTILTSGILQLKPQMPVHVNLKSEN
ncbi:MAG: efflux RND transporter periplasmic adaptor subunit [Saprospiraceae bacterium]